MESDKMELSLSDNIRTFRKQRKLTQEQFAEMLGVTTGAVYKWESGLSVPELNLIVEMADFFGLSVDALLGYKMRDHGIESILGRIHEYSRSANPEALAEAEKALRRYPNSFEVVYECAMVYNAFGTRPGGRDRLYRALELYEQASLLIAQNSDPKISSLTIYGQMAGAYILLGEQEKGIELMKNNNVGGIFDDSIGISLSLFMNRPEEAEPYLVEAILSGETILLNAATGYALVFLARNEISSAKEIIQWAIGFLLGLREGDTSDVLDKLHAALLIALAHIQIILEKADEAEKLVKQAAALAEKFDTAPNYGIDTMRFISVPKNIQAHDSLGITAGESIGTLLRMLHDQDLTNMWMAATAKLQESE